MQKLMITYISIKAYKNYCYADVINLKQDYALSAKARGDDEINSACLHMMILDGQYP